MLIAPSRAAGGRRILVVEDQPDIRALVVSALVGQGFLVDQAEDAAEGIRFLRGRRYDLVVAHYNMPGTTGAAMLRAAAAEGLLRDTAALVVTGHPDPEGVEGVPVIRKPLDLTEFLQQVHRIFHGPDDGAPPPGADAFSPAPSDGVAAAELVLYVLPGAPACTRALENFKKVAAGFDMSAVSFRTSDVSREPEMAEQDQVLFTPTLVKRSPPPPAWVLGDLSAQDVVTSLLEMCGLQRRPRRP